MRKLLWGFAVVLSASIIIIACQKEASSPRDAKSKFDDKAAKEWYYGTFKKSSEWESSNLKGKKLPDWKHPIIGKIGSFEVVEFPLNKAIKAYPIEKNNPMTLSDKKRLSEGSLSRILFIKTDDNKIIVREIDYIPDWSYLEINQFDISKVSVTNYKNNFTGMLMIKRWDGLVINSVIFDAGIAIKIATKAKTGYISDVGSQKNNSVEEIICTDYEFCVWQMDCQLIIWADEITEVCGEWYNTGNCWLEPYCEWVGTPCEMYGIECEEGEDDPPTGCTQQTADNTVNSASVTSLNIKEGIETISQSPTSITRKYKWKFYRVVPGIGSGITFSSQETGVQEKGGDGWWRWTSFDHSGETQSGGALFWDAVVNSLTATPSIINIEPGGPVNVTISIGGMQLDYVIKITYTCGVFLGASYPNGTSSNSWYTYEQ
jgi:hypothetical protein